MEILNNSDLAALIINATKYNDVAELRSTLIYVAAQLQHTEKARVASMVHFERFIAAQHFAARFTYVNGVLIGYQARAAGACNSWLYPKYLKGLAEGTKTTTRYYYNGKFNSN